MSSLENPPSLAIHNVGLDHTQQHFPQLYMVPKSERCMGSNGYDQEPMWMLLARLVTDPLSQPGYVQPNGESDILIKESPY